MIADKIKNARTILYYITIYAEANPDVTKLEFGGTSYEAI